MSADGGRAVPAGAHIATHSGRLFPLAGPGPVDIALVDIAQGLAQTCRFGGQCKRFYSVAEHSVRLAAEAAARAPDRATARGRARWALLHDAAEAYLGDVPTPLKPLLDGYDALERGILEAVALKFGLQWPLRGVPAPVKALDRRLLADEWPQVFAERPPPGHGLPDPAEGLGQRVRFWRPETARDRFLAAAARLGLAP